MTGLNDDDHPIYLLANGGRALTDNWNVGNYGIYGATWLNITSLKFTDELWWGSHNRTDVIAHPELTASYIVYMDGTTIYMKNGSTQAIDWSSTNASAIFEACISNLTKGGCVFAKAGSYNISTLITVESDVCLQFEEGSTVTPASDFDMFLVKPCASLVGLHADTTGLSFNSAVIKLEGYKYSEFETPRTLIRDVSGIGSTTGDFIYLHAQGGNPRSSIVFVTVENVKTKGFENVIHLHSNYTTTRTHINGNAFYNIHATNPVRAVYFSYENTATADVDIHWNKFYDIEVEAGDSTKRGIEMEAGRGNVMIACNLWDFTSGYAIHFGNYTADNYFQGLAPGRYIKDEGLKNIIEVYGRQPNYKVFEDFFIGSSLDAQWNMASGSVSSYGYGKASLQTGGITGNTAEIDWGGSYGVNPVRAVYIKAIINTQRASNYTMEVGLKAGTSNLIYAQFSTDIASGAKLACVNSDSESNATFSHSHTTTTLNVELQITDSFAKVYVNNNLEATVTANIPDNTWTEPYFKGETLENTTLTVRIHYYYLRW